MNVLTYFRYTSLILGCYVIISTLHAEQGWMMEKFPSVGGSAVSNLVGASSYFSAPQPSVLSSSEIPSNSGDNYGTRVRGYIIAPASGDYIFWESGDDAVQLYLSQDENPALKRLIAFHSPGTSPQQWDKYPTQKSRLISLEAGRKYYVEALHKEGTGNDHLAIAWTPPDGDRTLIPLSAMETFDLFTPTTSQGLTLETFNNMSGSQIANLTSSSLYPHSPNSSVVLASGQGPINVGNNHGTRTRGWIVPQTSGNYTFWESGDDAVQLYLSPDESPADKQLIASHTGWTNPNEWGKYSSQKSRTLSLTAGKAYYIEILHKEGGGSDHFAVAWTPPGGVMEILPESVLHTWAPHPTDLDDDKITDFEEVGLGLDPAVAADGYADSDNDGIPNNLEYINGAKSNVLDSVNGYINDNVWFNLFGDKLTRASYKAAATRTYDARSYLSITQSADVGDNYVRRYRGYITAPLSGEYQFWITADDDADFHFSTSDSKFDLVHIIRNDVLGRGNFDLDPSQKSALITLEAGEKYYFEIWHKDQTGNGSAAVAWKTPGVSRQIISAHYLSSYAFDADDLDDDDLPDSYEMANGLDPNDDGRSSGSTDGAYGDLDGDGLTNREEWKNNTAANLVDTDGDGVNDYDEVNFFGSATLANNIGAFVPLTTINGDAYTSCTGEWDNFGGMARQNSRRGSVTYPLTVPMDGIYAFKFTISAIQDGVKNEQYDFHLKINGQHIAYKTINILPDGTSTLALLSPWLQAGENYQLEIFVDNSYNHRRVSINQLDILSAGGTDSNSNSIPDWTEIRVNDLNGLDNIGITHSRTSPAIIEGKANYLGLVATNAPTLVAAPNGRYFTEIALGTVNASQPAELNFAFENGGLSQTSSIYWQPTNLLYESSITLRQGDSLLLTAFVDAENASLETYTYTLDGTSVTNSADQLVPQLFDTAGEYNINVSHTAVDGSVSTRSISVTVVSKVSISPPSCVVGYTRDWSAPVMPAATSLEFDERINVSPGNTASSYLITTDTPINQPILARSSSGLILGSSHVKSFSVKGSDLTGPVAIETIGTSQVVEMAVVAYGDVTNSEIQCVIFQGGVTYMEGTTTQTMNASSFDALNTAILQFNRPLSAYAICHLYRVYDGSKLIALYY